MGQTKKEELRSLYRNNMTQWLYQKKWYLIGSFIAFLAIFGVTIYFSIESGEENLSPVKVYFLLFCWWAGIISLYTGWLAETLHGKFKDKSNLVKALKMAFPTFFVLFAAFTISKFIGNV